MPTRCTADRLPWTRPRAPIRRPGRAQPRSAVRTATPSVSANAASSPLRPHFDQLHPPGNDPPSQHPPDGTGQPAATQSQHHSRTNTTRPPSSLITTGNPRGQRLQPRNADFVDAYAALCRTLSVARQFLLPLIALALAANSWKLGPALSCLLRAWTVTSWSPAAARSAPTVASSFGTWANGSKW